MPVEDFTCKVHSNSKASDVEDCLYASIDAARRDPETGIVLLTLNLLFTPLTPCRFMYLHTSVFEKYLEKWGDIETFAERETYIIDYIWIGVSGRAFCCFWFKICFPSNTKPLVLPVEKNKHCTNPETDLYTQANNHKLGDTNQQLTQTLTHFRDAHKH